MKKGWAWVAHCNCLALLPQSQSGCFNLCTEVAAGEELVANRIFCYYFSRCEYKE